MPEPRNSLDEPGPDVRGGRVFLRLLGFLRPEWPMIAIGVVLLILAMPCELFPGLVWKYVTDDVLLAGTTRPMPVLSKLVPLGGAVHGKPALLVSALCWLLVVYLVGEFLGTLSNWLM